MEQTALPAYYDDLDATRMQALKLLARGVKDRRSAMHTFCVATIGADGAPRMRTVVNRGYDPEGRILRFHTDARAPKLDELRGDPRVAIHAYDPRGKIQLRLGARATVHLDGELREAAWRATRDFSRACYRVVPAPGQGASVPQDVAFTPGEDADEGLENFAVVTLKITSLEWLYLAHQGHRRAHFAWSETDTLSQQWLVP